MPQATKKIRELTREIEALRSEDRMQLLRNVLTPEMELRLLAEDLRQRTQGHDPREVAREVDEAVREVRQQRKQAFLFLPFSSCHAF